MQSHHRFRVLAVRKNTLYVYVPFRIPDGILISSYLAMEPLDEFHKDPIECIWCNLLYCREFISGSYHIKYRVRHESSFG